MIGGGNRALLALLPEMYARTGSADKLPLVVPVGTIYLGPACTATACSVG